MPFVECGTCGGRLLLLYQRQFPIGLEPGFSPLAKHHEVFDVVISAVPDLLFSFSVKLKC